MNKTGLSLLDRSVGAVRESAGLDARVIPPRAKIRTGKAVLEIRVAPRQRYRFTAIVKTVDRFETPGQAAKRVKAGEPPILVAPYITEDIAGRCRELRLAFIDTAGNAYLERPGLFVWVTGRKRPAPLRQPRFRALSPAGLRITFVLLCQPDLVAANYREIARAAGVALGSVGPAIKDLEARGLIRRKRHPRLLDPGRLIEEWVARYPTALRDKLNPRRFEADAALLAAADLTRLNAYWGGEVAADRLTHMLKPAAFTIYAAGSVAKLAAAARLRAHPGGRVEILDVFWNFPRDPERPDVAPPLLAYADLMASGDSRNIEAAKLIHDRFIEPALHTAG